MKPNVLQFAFALWYYAKLRGCKLKFLFREAYNGAKGEEIDSTIQNARNEADLSLISCILTLWYQFHCLGSVSFSWRLRYQHPYWLHFISFEAVISIFLPSTPFHAFQRCYIYFNAFSLILFGLMSLYQFIPPSTPFYAFRICDSQFPFFDSDLCSLTALT